MTQEKRKTLGDELKKMNKQRAERGLPPIGERGSSATSKPQKPQFETNQQREEAVKEVMGVFDDRRNAVMKNTDLNDEARQRRLAGIHSEREKAVSGAVDEVLGDLDSQIDQNREKAAPKPKKPSAEEVQVREAQASRYARRLTARWAKEPPTQEQYQEILDRGDEAEIEAFEDLAVYSATGRNANALAMTISDEQDRRAEASLTDSQKQARVKVAELERDKFSLGVTLESLRRREQQAREVR